MRTVALELEITSTSIGFGEKGGISGVKRQILFQFMKWVATALLVAGSTLTFWIPGQTLFASTSSYSSVV